MTVFGNLHMFIPISYFSLPEKSDCLILCDSLKNNLFDKRIKLIDYCTKYFDEYTKNGDESFQIN